MLNRNGTSVKYTAVLPTESIKELKMLSEMKIIASINQGIRMAVEEFIRFHKQQVYECAMMEAATDEDFIKRTLETQSAFAAVDMEGETEW